MKVEMTARALNEHVVFVMTARFPFGANICVNDIPKRSRLLFTPT